MTDVSNETSMPLMPQSPGALMKAGRERAGIHLAVLSANLKVPVKQLTALEADDFDQLASPVFARALAAKFCRLVKIDPEPVLALMPANTNGLKPLVLIGDAENSASPASHKSASHSDRPGFKWWWLALAIVLALILSNDWIVTVLRLDDSTESAQTLPTMPPEELPAVAETAPTEPPKAMVFDASNTPQVVTPNASAPTNQTSPTVTAPAAGVPHNTAPVNASTEPTK